RIVHENHLGRGCKGAGKEDLLLVSARQRQDWIVHVRGSYLDPLLPAFADPIFLFSVDQIARRERLQGGNAEVLQYAPERERTVQSAVSCHESHLRLAHWQPVA